jgi:hypothetical protein
VGQKSSTETVVAVIQAFLQRRTWSQIELSREVEVGVPALRKRLLELEARGFPFVREDDPPNVFWSVPKDWFPGGVLFTAGDALELLRHLGRLPKSASRDRFIRRILDAAPRQEAIARGEREAVIAPSATESEQSYLALAEDAATGKVPLECKYFTVSRGALEWRRLSVQRVLVGPPARLLAVCHRDGALKWFRLENVQAARLDAMERYRPADPAQVEAVLAESLDGFHQGGAPVRCAFIVSDPESGWVSRNLLPSMTTEAIPGGLRVVTTTAGVLRLARYVAGLGGVTRIETPELRAAVRELARGALEAAEERPAAVERWSHSAQR